MRHKFAVDAGVLRHRQCFLNTGGGSFLWQVLFPRIDWRLCSSFFFLVRFRAFCRNVGVSADEAGGDALQHALRATTRDQDVEETKVVMGVRECCVLERIGQI